MSIVRAIRAHVDRHPDREVATFRDLEASAERRLSYGELWSGASAVAEALEGFAKTPRTLIVLPLGADVLLSHLGTLLAGGIPVIHSHPSSKVAPDVYIKHLAHVLELLAPDVVITRRRFRDALEKAQGGKETPSISIEDLAGSTGFVPRAWEHAPADGTAIIQHSSGSTGLQKGVALTHAMVIEQCSAYARAIRIDRENDRVCSWIPLYHDMGLFTTWLMPVIEGIRVSAIDPFAWVQSPASFLSLIHDHRGTLAWQPNFAYNLLSTRVKDAEIEGLDLSSMRGFSNCSEPVRASSHRAFLERFRRFGLRPESLWVCYAMAENSFAVTCAGEPPVPVEVKTCAPDAFARGRIERAEEGRGIEIVSVGAPVEGCAIKVVDAERKRVDDGVIGEVAIQSGFVLREYFNNQEATQAAIDAERWYYSGDLGFQLEGQLYITGRKKDLLIVGGRNFYPQDIEAVADGCAGAIPGRSVAIGVDDEKTGTQRIVLLAESKRTREAEKEDLAQKIRQRVFEELDCPLSEVHVVPHMWLLKTTSGKIARAPNLARFREELSPKAPQPLPKGGLWAAAFWGLVVALAVYVYLALEPNLSWGIYAGF